MHKSYKSITVLPVLLLLTLIAYSVARPANRGNQQCPQISIECPTELPEVERHTLLM